MQIAELYNLAPGTFAVTDLRVTVKNAYLPKPSTGQYGGHTQNAVVADASGEIGVLIFDGPELQRGMPILLTSTQGKGNKFEGVYTEVRDSNGQQILRLTVKGKVPSRVQILSSGQGVPPQGFQGQQQGWQPPAAQQPVQGTWQAQGTPPAQQGWQQRNQQGMLVQAGPASSGKAWTPKPKMNDREARFLLVRQFELIRADVATSLGASSPESLEVELLAHCMAWATSVLIGVEDGKIEIEKPSALPAPQAAGGQAEQWPGQVPPMQGQGWQSPQSGQQGWAAADATEPGNDEDVLF